MRMVLDLNVMLNGEALEEVDQFKYLGSVIAANGGSRSRCAS